MSLESMDDNTRPIQHADVERACFQLGWENLDWIEEWDGVAVDDLALILSAEEYQMLLDQLQDPDFLAG